MSKVEFRIHWLSLTIHASKIHAMRLYEYLFEEYFGQLEALGHGGRGYREIYRGLLQFKIYTVPINENQKHFHIEIPGQACDAIPLTRFQALYDYLELGFPENRKFKRVDLAFDHLDFTPEDVSTEIVGGRIRTLARRETFRIISSFFAPREDGQLGTYTAELGSNESDRKITVYNKRGYTRFEFQAKNVRADVICADIFNHHDFKNWGKIAIKHLRDYIDFEANWWRDFIESQPRANVTVTTPRQKTLERSILWLQSQVAPTLSMVEDAVGEGFSDLLVRHGRKSRTPRHRFIIGEKGEDV